jgi:hypothetical protein
MPWRTIWWAVVDLLCDGGRARRLVHSAQLVTLASSFSPFAAITVGLAVAAFARAKRTAVA